MAFDNTASGGYAFPQGAENAGGLTKVEFLTTAFLCAWIQASGRIPTDATERAALSDLAIALAAKMGEKVTTYETT